MIDARQRDQWNHTAYFAAAIFEVNRDKKARKDPFSPREFHPMERTESEARQGDGIRPGTAEWKAFGRAFVVAQGSRRVR